MRQSCWIRLVAAVSMIVASPALSQDYGGADFGEPDYADKGGYMIVGGLNGFELFTEDTRATIDGSTFGFEIRGGYRFGRYLAAELEGDFLSGWTVNVPSAIGNIPLEADGGNITANLKAYLPLGRLQPYGMVGIGGMWASLNTGFVTGTVCTPSFYGWWCSGTTTQLADGGGFVAKFGGGTDVMITETFGLSIDASYVLPTGDLSDFAYLSLNWGAIFKY